MISLTLVAMIALLPTMGGILILYYRKICKKRGEYLNAKEILSDIIISFNRQLSEQEKKLKSVMEKADIALFKSKLLEKNIKDHDSRFKEVDEKISNLIIVNNKFSAKIEEIDGKVEEVIKDQKSFRKGLSRFRNEKYEVKENVPIPIKKDEAISRLTETELRVLKALANEGAKTASEIRSKINLTREHTARLMKKLYEQGYLDRDSGKIPYSYKIKDEMLRLLKEGD